MQAFQTLESKTVVLKEAHIDTDQIIPARFLKVTKKDGLGVHAFSDWRYDEAGKEKDFVLNQIDPQAHQILVAGDNFGCGSSREHAPWALLDFGFRAIISTSFADIFKNNALKNGLLPVEVSPEFHQLLLKEPTKVKIDLIHDLVSAAGHAERFVVDPFARNCLLRGMDQLGFLMDHLINIEAFERKSA